MFDGPFAWLMVIVALVLIFGGGKRLPDIGRGLGGFIREFKRAQNEEPGEKKKEELLGASAVDKLEQTASSADKHTPAV